VGETERRGDIVDAVEEGEEKEGDESVVIVVAGERRGETAGESVGTLLDP
jgi:hypothetical protein